MQKTQPLQESTREWQRIGGGALSVVRHMDSGMICLERISCPLINQQSR